MKKLFIVFLIFISVPSFSKPIEDVFVDSFVGAIVALVTSIIVDFVVDLVKKDIEIKTERNIEKKRMVNSNPYVDAKSEAYLRLMENRKIKKEKACVKSSYNFYSCRTKEENNAEAGYNKGKKRAKWLSSDLYKKIQRIKSGG